MAFPAVAAVNGGSDNSAKASHTISLPSDISDGDLLIAIVTMTDPGISSFPAMTWPGGWTQLWSRQFDGSFQVFGTCDAYFRRADGGEGASIAVTVTPNCISSHTTYRITGHHATTDPEGTATTLGSEDTSPNPPNLNPSGWDSEEALWFAVCGYGDNNGPNITGWPTDYTNTREDSYVGNTGPITGTARRELSAASENPGVFTAASHDWSAGTIAIRPAAAAGDPVEENKRRSSWNILPHVILPAASDSTILDVHKQQVAGIYSGVSIAGAPEGPPAALRTRMLTGIGI